MRTAVEPPVQGRLKGARELPLVAALLAIAALLYSGTLAARFTNYDDDWQVKENPVIRDLSRQGIIRILTHADHGEFLPLKTLSYALDYRIFGLEEGAFHFTNYLLWLTSIVFLYLFLRSVLGSLTSFLGGLFYIVHPIHVEAVAWISARKHLLALLFVLASVVLFSAYRRKWEEKRFTSTAGGLSGFYFLSLIAFSLAVLSNATALALPLGIFLYDIALFPVKRNWRIILLDKIPFLAIGLAAVIWGLAVVYGMEYVGFVPGESYFVLFLTMLKVFALYLWKLALPIRLCAQYLVMPERSILSWKGIASAGVAVGFLIGLLLARKFNRRVFFGMLWFLAFLIPVSNLIPVRTPSLMADRYLLIPSVGVSLVLGTLTYRVFTRRGRSASLKGLKAIVAVGLSCLFIFYGVQTVRRVADWKSSESLWASEVERNPLNYNALHNLGQAILDKAEATTDEGERKRLFLEAEGFFLAAVGRREDYILSFYNLGYIALAEKRLFIAEEMLTKVVELPDPPYMAKEIIHRTRAKAHFGRGRIRLNDNRFEEALQEFDAALAEEPQFAKAHYYRGITLAALGRLKDADLALKEALRLNPSDEEVTLAKKRLAILPKLRVQLPSEAMRFLGSDASVTKRYKALAQKENLIGAKLVVKNRLSQGLIHIKRALYYDPELVSAHVNLAVAMFQMGKTEAAIKHLERVVKLWPDEPDVTHALAKLYADQKNLDKAESFCRETIRLDPRRRDAYLDLAEIYKMEGKTERALQVLSEASRIFPGDALIEKKQRALQES